MAFPSSPSSTLSLWGLPLFLSFCDKAGLIFLVLFVHFECSCQPPNVCVPQGYVVDLFSSPPLLFLSDLCLGFQLASPCRWLLMCVVTHLVVLNLSFTSWEVNLEELWAFQAQLPQAKFILYCLQPDSSDFLLAVNNNFILSAMVFWCPLLPRLSLVVHITLVAFSQVYPYKASSKHFLCVPMPRGIWKENHHNLWSLLSLDDEILYCLIFILFFCNRHLLFMYLYLTYTLPSQPSLVQNFSLAVSSLHSHFPALAPLLGAWFTCSVHLLLSFFRASLQ